jgi:dihydroorotase
LREPADEAEEETIATAFGRRWRADFTNICCMPNTNPAIDNQESVRFSIARRGLLAEVFPIAAITKGARETELTECRDAKAGAVAFSDDGTPLKNSQVMRYALEYSKLTGKRSQPRRRY